MNSNASGNGQAMPSGLGFLIVRATTARGAIPIEGALVSVRSYEPEMQDGRGDVVFSTVTNRDGNTPPIPLSAPPRESSLTAGNANPFTSYLVDVYHEGYSTLNYINVPIFDGITAIQPADLIPLPENGRTDSRTPDSEQFFESSAPEL